MTYRLQLSETFVMSERDLSYGKNRTFFHKNKNAVQWGFLLCCPHPSSLKKKKKLWCLIRVPDVCMYLFISIFIGYVVGVAPVISFHYGAGNTSELKGLLKKSIILISGCSVAMLLLSQSLFLGYRAV